jgi:signal transduction histidine kinase
LLSAIIEGILGLFIIMIIILLLYNRRITKSIWKKFYSNLGKMKNYGLMSLSDLNLENTDIDEFNDLNNVINRMADQIRNDYNNLKEFTENASHEIHTPLAIIKSKIEILIQSENLTEDELKQLIAINNSAARLSRLNQSLMLLTRIENRQFKEEKNINLREVIEKLAEELSELAEIREIKIIKKIDVDYFININPGLIEILVRNLLTNAIRYCDSDGLIEISLINNEMSFSNSGRPLSVPVDLLFERFKKNVQESDSLGLGLAIVRSICNIYNLQIEYKYNENKHIFKIIF